MGRQEPSQGLAPPLVRKQLRAKHAKTTVNKTIPALLISDARARKGTEESILIRDPVSGADPRPTTHLRTKSKGKGAKGQDDVVDEGETPLKGAKRSGKTKSVQRGSSKLSDGEAEAEAPSSSKGAACKFSIRATDSLTAAFDLQSNSRANARKVGVLNMASALRPGGGVLQGATSQEEFLCTRTTLLPSLKDEYYRLPEVGGIWSPDVLVFRIPDVEKTDKGDGEGDRELKRAERFYIDVFSSGMIRLPELSEDGTELANRKDEDLIKRKMMAVRDVFLQKGCKKIVLGTWGCGAYGCPVKVIARCWKEVLQGSEQDSAAFSDVVFAIKERNMAIKFERAWGKGIEFDRSAGTRDGEEENEDEGDAELDERIEQLRTQMEATRFPLMKERLGSVLEFLEKQRRGPARPASGVDPEGIDDRGEEVGRTEDEEEPDNDSEDDSDRSSSY